MERIAKLKKSKAQRKAEKKEAKKLQLEKMKKDDVTEKGAAKVQWAGESWQSRYGLNNEEEAPKEAPKEMPRQMTQDTKVEEVEDENDTDIARCSVFISLFGSSRAFSKL